MSIPKKAIGATLATGVGLYALYRLHQYLYGAKPNNGDIYLGQYSIIHQVLELARLGKITPPATIYAIKHFTQRAHSSIVNDTKWGQKPFETPLSMESSPAIQQARTDQYLTLQDVISIRGEAIRELKERGFTVFEVDAVNNINRSNDKIYVTSTTNGAQSTNVHSKDAIVFNSATKPRQNRTESFRGFNNTEVLYERGNVVDDCPKIVSGAGPSAVWVKERCPKVQVLFCSPGAVSGIHKFVNNPRNTATIQSISEQDQVDLEKHAISTGKEILSLDDSQEWHINLKKKYRAFMERYAHLNLKPENVALVIDLTTRQCIAIGEGINAVGYEGNLGITNTLPPGNVLNLHILPNEPAELSVAPQEILGSIMHNLDYQRMLLADFYNSKGAAWSLEERMILLPIERLFLRVKDSPPVSAHSGLIKAYLNEHTGLDISDAYFRNLEQEIRRMQAGPRDPGEATHVLVQVYANTDPKPSADDVGKFRKAFDSLMQEKQKKLATVYKKVVASLDQ